MRLPRFKIRSLLGVVLFAGIAIAALRQADDLWDSGMLGLTLLGLMTAVLLAVHRTDHRRAYWVGFALFGWTYLIASLIPQIAVRLPTSLGLAFIDSKIPGRHRAWATTVLTITSTAGTNPVQTGGLSPQGNTLASSSQEVSRVWDVRTGELLAGPFATTENFIRIGHSLLALVLAFLGGYLSRHLYRTGQGQSSSAQPVLSPPA